MNTISKTILSSLTVLLLVSCLQGPWDYVPEDPDLYEGIWTTGILIADSKVSNICFEPMMKLTQEYSASFGFYDSAKIQIAGEWDLGSDTLVLTSTSGNPNCFQGDSSHHILRGKDYNLNALIWWDSSGTKIRSHFEARAHVPTKFMIADSATAPSSAFIGAPKVEDTAKTGTPLDFLSELPPEIRDSVLNVYKDTLMKISGDSIAQQEFFKEEMPKLQELLAQITSVYHNGDSLFYLAGNLNFSAHKYSSEWSDDLSGVLIVQKWDSTVSKGTFFADSLFGPPDTGVFYVPGTQRRTLFYEDQPLPGDENRNLLSELTMPQTFFFIGENRLYFYGFEKPYTEYIQTAIVNMDNPKVPKKYNIQGGKGIFAGAIVDSFEVNILADSSTQAFSVFDAGIWQCREGEAKRGPGAPPSEPLWHDTKFCRDHYKSWCSSVDFSHSTCAEASVRVALDSGFTWSTILENTGPANISLSAKTTARIRGEQIWCIAHNYSSASICSSVQDSCSAVGSGNFCKEDLWTFCKDENWDYSKFPQCAEALLSYCEKRDVDAPYLCNQKQVICNNQIPASEYCK